MSRKKFRDMETPEQQYAREVAARPHRPVGEPTRAEWARMDVEERGAYLARELGNEENARDLERVRAERLNPQPEKKRWGWRR
ncbi:hypothetical protein AB0911_12225 [Streptomyces nigra]|uniref:hypothetical protein n=1 Tax=Streptomyces nigra TaxID=1827580 RepID=UPI0034512368